MVKLIFLYYLKIVYFLFRFSLLNYVIYLIINPIKDRRRQISHNFKSCMIKLNTRITGLVFSVPARIPGKWFWLNVYSMQQNKAGWTKVQVLWLEQFFINFIFFKNIQFKFKVNSQFVNCLPDSQGYPLNLLIQQWVKYRFFF